MSWLFVLLVGVFIPAYSFTLIGHALFDKLVQIPFMHQLLDGKNQFLVFPAVSPCASDSASSHDTNCFLQELRLV
eukprot:m.673513 g.673513  ORF g.673513 m.673513 type:complete len:75 (-) comp58544_c0_seq9:338-562(-)